MLSGLVLVGSFLITVSVLSVFVRSHEYAAAALRGSTDKSEHSTTFLEMKSASPFSVVTFSRTGSYRGGWCMLYSVAGNTVLSWVSTGQGCEWSGILLSLFSTKAFSLQTWRPRRMVVGKSSFAVVL